MIHCESTNIELAYTERHHLDVLHFVIEECRHLANGCTAKCDCMLFCYISYNILCLGDITNIGFASVYACPVCDASVASCATVH